MALKEFYKYTDHLTVPILFGFCSLLRFVRKFKGRKIPGRFILPVVNVTVTLNLLQPKPLFQQPFTT